jgi:U3 small nucleolar RNA-associated protein 6
MWTEYVKMELGFIESLRRRWDVLGIDVGKGDKGKDREQEIDIDMDDDETGVDLDAKDAVEEEDESARNEIMEGAIVKAAISNAAQGPSHPLFLTIVSLVALLLPSVALPKITMFTALQTLITTYPLPEPLRETLLEYLYGLLEETLPDDPRAVKLFATRKLSTELEGEALVDALKSANEELLRTISRDGVDQVYAEFVEEWIRADLDENLVGILIFFLFPFHFRFLTVCFLGIIAAVPHHVSPFANPRHRPPTTVFALRTCQTIAAYTWRTCQALTNCPKIFEKSTEIGGGMDCKAGSGTGTCK